MWTQQCSFTVAQAEYCCRSYFAGDILFEIIFAGILILGFSLKVHVISRFGFREKQTHFPARRTEAVIHFTTLQYTNISGLVFRTAHRGRRIFTSVCLCVSVSLLNCLSVDSWLSYTSDRFSLAYVQLSTSLPVCLPRVPAEKALHSNVCILSEL
jgi:hypothetical protein